MTPGEEQAAEEARLDAADPKLETAVFGRDVERFIEEDPIGRYLIARAREQIDEAAQALLTVDPTDAQQVSRLQNKAAVAGHIATWLGEAVQAGRDATVALQQERDTYGA